MGCPGETIVCPTRTPWSYSECMTKRLFVGITFSDEVVDALVADQASLAPYLRLGRMSARENLHLTLAFLGDADADIERRAREAVDLTARAGHPMELTLGELGFFDHRGRLVAWRGIAPDDGLDDLVALQACLVRELALRGIAVDARPYRPHVTLARNVRLEDEASVVPLPVSFTATTVRLMWSHHPEGGALAYTPILSADLGASGAPAH